MRVIRTTCSSPLTFLGFLIVACDGLWDVMGDNDATDIVKRHLAIYGNDLEGACVRLVFFFSLYLLSC